LSGLLSTVLVFFWRQAFFAARDSGGFAATFLINVIDPDCIPY
jgi:hypothetical protein